MATFQFFMTIFVQLAHPLLSRLRRISNAKHRSNAPGVYRRSQRDLYRQDKRTVPLSSTLTPKAYIECEAYIERPGRISKIPTGSISTGQEPSLRPMVIIGQFSALIFAYLHTATWLPAGGLTFLFRQESKQRSRPGEALHEIFRYVPVSPK